MDREMADVVITLHGAWVEKIDEAIVHLHEVGLDVNHIDRAGGIVEGLIDAHELPSLRRLDCVSYIRIAREFGANYPPGDPRDRDGR